METLGMEKAGVASKRQCGEKAKSTHEWPDEIHTYKWKIYLKILDVINSPFQSEILYAADF